MSHENGEGNGNNEISLNEVHILVNMANPVPEIGGETGEKQRFGREFEKVRLHFSEWTGVRPVQTNTVCSFPH